MASRSLLSLRSSQPSQLYVLPRAPIGDIFADAEEGDAYDVDEMGDTQIDYDDAEQGSPKALTAAQLAKKVAAGTATAADRKALATLKKNNPAAASYVTKAANAHRLSQNKTLLYEHFKGAELTTSTLGLNATLDPPAISALKNAIYSSTPFEPLNLTVTGATIDIEDELFKLIGASPFYYTGLIIVLSASINNINQGALISIIRTLGSVGGSVKSVTNNAKLASGVGAVEALLLNGTQVAGSPRFWAPFILPKSKDDAAPNPRNYTVTFGGLPTNYGVSIRFLQPGDSQVDNFLKIL
jgi:hypothetical protein